MQVPSPGKYRGKQKQIKQITNMEKRVINFKRDTLRRYKHITGPMTKVELVVASNVTEANRVNATDPGQSDKYIVNFEAIAPDQLPKLIELFKDNEQLSIEQTNGLFLTGSLWVKKTADGEEIPTQLLMKGEVVHANIGYVDNADKTQKLLRITNFQSQAPAVAKALDFDAIFGITEEAGEETAAERDVVQTRK